MSTNRSRVITIFIFISNLYIVVSQFPNGAIPKQEYDMFEKLRNKLDRPVKTDLISYLDILHNVATFFITYKEAVDLNVQAGLFITNVNLRYALQKKESVLPRHMVRNIKLIIENNDAIMNYYRIMVRMDNNPKDKLMKRLHTLFVNQTQWVSQIKDFNLRDYNPPLIHNYKELEKEFGRWGTFNDLLAGKGTPEPSTSDFCHSQLAGNPVHRTNDTNCDVSEACSQMVLNGTDYGYFLNHRLLILLFARYGRKCTIISKQKDEEMINKFCDISYREAEYIVHNDYSLIDLLLENMFSCLMAGRTDNLRRSWLLQIPRFATDAGCFSATSMKETIHIIKPQQFNGRLKWRIENKGMHSMLNGICDSHVTILACVTYGIATRYLLETFY